jgi:RAB6A-GEF complex partner protein 2
MSETRLNDTALRIVVTPSQSSYFAGETLSVTIAITNTRSLQAQVVPPRSTHTHKRSAHSVSSARLARPPTSPGLPKSPSNAVGPRPYPPPKPSAPTRKGLIGITSPDREPRGESVLARRVAAKSLSVDIPSHELPKTLPDDMKMSPLRAVRRAGEPPSSCSPRVCAFRLIILRRGKPAARVIPASPHILHTCPPKSPTCSESVNY